MAHIINSLLDTDFYKFTMQQAVFQKFPKASAEFKFKLRNYPKKTLIPYVDEINEEIAHLCSLRFKEDELTYLLDMPEMDANYIDFLADMKLDNMKISCHATKKDFYLGIGGGSWLNTILFEVPVLAIVSEVYFRNKDDKTQLQLDSIKRLKAKTRFVMDKPWKFADFGTRRRWSFDFQNSMLNYFRKTIPENIVGTSNVYFAKKYGMRPIGTMAHEWIQGMQAMVPIQDSQKFAFQTWADVYHGRLGIALSDTLGMNAFYKDFDRYFAKLYDGARHDSGDPFTWCNKLIAHYTDLGIDPMTKTAVFSDGLDFNLTDKIYHRYSNKIKMLFGIGTYLTNDTGLKPLQIVIKMTKCNGQDVAKISDSDGKQMCENPIYLAYIKSVIAKKIGGAYD